MAIEIEKKFLIKRIPTDQIIRSESIKQGYIVSDKKKVIRVREKGDDYYITIKGNKIGISRFEFEYKIPRSDALELFENFCDEKYAIYCAQHNYQTAETVKMYGNQQYQYSRKFWSSLVFYNCSHDGHKNFSVDDVNTKPGRWLHNFLWLSRLDRKNSKSITNIFIGIIIKW